MKPRVIVIDDDHDTVEVFSEFLRIKGCEVLARGYDGKEAVSLYKKHKPDFVLMDVMMPEYNGFYGLKNIKMVDRNAQVIMVTADLEESTSRRLNEMGATRILYKPYDIDMVVGVIQELQNNAIKVNSN